MDDFFEFMGVIFAALLIVGILVAVFSPSFGDRCRLNGGSPMSTALGEACAYKTNSLMILN